MTWVSIVVEDFKDYKDVLRVKWVSNIKEDTGIFDKEILIEKGKPFRIEIVD